MKKNLGFVAFFVFPACPLAAQSPESCSGEPSVSIAEVVSVLADSTFEGRELGTAGEQRARSILQDAFATAGLAPAGPEDTYLQAFTAVDGVPLDVPASNVVGWLNPERRTRDPVIVVGAHYDHLGLADDSAGFFPGADDNASGVGALLWIADRLASCADFHLPVLFIAFTGEEARMLGSRYFVSHPLVPLPDIALMINLDMVGRLSTNGLDVSGFARSAVWRPYFQSEGEDFRGNLVLSDSITRGSDHLYFHRAGVPTLKLHTGKHEDWHRMTDTPDRVDHAGVYEVARLVAGVLRRHAHGTQP